ncbi:MAG: Gfo/Idh/MocA family protein [Candidatus Binataceae bacterium]
MIRFGILGTARVASYGLLQPVRQTPGVEVAAVASRTLGKAQSFAALHEIPQAFGSYSELLEDGSIDAVYVALPTGLHYEWARQAIEAGKHVLCEKPLASNAELSSKLVLCAKEHERVILEAMHIRYASTLRRQRELVASGDFGRLLRVDSCFRAPRIPMAEYDFRLRPELGGGAGLDLGCYAVSCLRYVAGEEPDVVSVSYRSAASQVDRWMRAKLRFPSGAEGVAECGFRGLYRPRFGVVVVCERGWIKWDRVGLRYKRDGQVIREAISANWTYQLQVEAFVKSVRGESSDILQPEDSVATARVLDAMYEKAGLGPRV